LDDVRLRLEELADHEGEVGFVGLGHGFARNYTPLAKRTKTVYKYRYGGVMTEELTPKQQKILNFVRKSIEKTGFPPTRIQISKAFNYSSANAAEEHLRMLERKGAIELTPGASRGIRLTEGLGLPLV